MTIRRGWMTVAAVGTSLVLLAGCSSGSNSAGTTATTSVATSGAANPSDAVTTVGGDTTEFDDRTTTWFDTMCTGMEPLTGLQDGSTPVNSAADLSAAMADVGTSMQDTASQLSALPPPSFEGGDTLASTVQSGLQSFGQTFTDFSTRAAELNDGDTAGQQQFLSDLQAEIADSPIAKLDATPEVQAQIKKIPACQPFFGS